MSEVENQEVEEKIERLLNISLPLEWVYMIQ